MECHHPSDHLCNCRNRRPPAPIPWQFFENDRTVNGCQRHGFHNCPECSSDSSEESDKTIVRKPAQENLRYSATLAQEENIPASAASTAAETGGPAARTRSESAPSPLTAANLAINQEQTNDDEITPVLDSLRVTTAQANNLTDVSTQTEAQRRQTHDEASVAAASALANVPADSRRRRRRRNFASIERWLDRVVNVVRSRKSKKKPAR